GEDLTVRAERQPNGPSSVPLEGGEFFPAGHVPQLDLSKSKLQLRLSKSRKSRLSRLTVQSRPASRGEGLAVRAERQGALAHEGGSLWLPQATPLVPAPSKVSQIDRARVIVVEQRVSRGGIVLPHRRHPC